MSHDMSDSPPPERELLEIRRQFAALQERLAALEQSLRLQRTEASAPSPNPAPPPAAISFVSPPPIPVIPFEPAERFAPARVAGAAPAPIQPLASILPPSSETALADGA